MWGRRVKASSWAWKLLAINLKNAVSLIIKAKKEFSTVQLIDAQ